MSKQGRVRGLVHHGLLDELKLQKHPLSEKILNRTRRRLLRWGRHNFRPYCWRFEDDPWLSFVAEFLLQRTRASQVEPVFQEFKERFPTADALARSGTHTIREITERLGLHWRGPLLVSIAKQITEEDGVLPNTMEELCQLNGVGMYTAAAWLSLHQGKRAVILDANVCRWLSRMTGLPYNRDPRHIHWIQELADDLTPRKVFRDYNYAVLDLTMNICTPRKPSCEECPLNQDCRYARTSYHCIMR